VYSSDDRKGHQIRINLRKDEQRKEPLPSDRMRTGVFSSSHFTTQEHCYEYYTTGRGSDSKRVDEACQGA
jgi:hypothetical protein